MSARRRAERILFALAFVLGGLAVVLPGGQAPAGAAEGVVKSVTAVRTFIDADGKETEQSRDKVKLRVSQTTNLRGRQEIKVSWEGAHPTGAVAADPSSSDARNQEYPFVLLQCRGVDTDGAAPKGQVKLSPETCWTQTAPERYLAAASNTPSWRFDAWAPAKDRQAVVGPPADLPAACSSVSRLTTERWLPFKAAGGTTYYGGPDPGTGCMPLPPESDDAESGGLPSNTTYGITGKDGKGSVDFAVWTKAENASLGCSAKVACSLVAVPVVGISCDAWGTTLPEGTQLTTKAGVPLTESQIETGDATCRRTGSYEAGEPAASRTSDQAVRGNLWWSASNWRNRITVPLEFAQTAEVCPVESAEKPLELMGSVMLNELTASWRPKFCTTSSLYSFTHVQQAESLARSLVQSGEIKGAFSTAPQPGGYQRPVAQAPIAFSGFAIAFSIDDGDKQRREELNLNARLVAKLLSASYPAVSFVRNGHPGLGDNPLNITLDPEFRALNPGIDERSTLQAGAALQIFSSNSDLVWALTRWLDADPEARAWLDGTPDPWGMKVNPAYKGLELPVDNWPLLDDYVAPQWYIDDNACYRKSPTPYLQLVANPLSGLGAIGLNLQFASSAAATVCRYDGYDATTLPLRTEGRQSVGYRFVLGLVSLPAARRYNLRTAALQSTSTVATGQQFGDAAGRTFVEPDTTGLKAAAGLLAADDDAGTWVLDDAKLATAQGRAAYPGAMPVYAVFPTSGEEKATATKLAKFLCYAGGAGQVPGQANGSLPAGYLPLTDDNGFATQQAYLANAVNAVRAQEGAVPALEVNGKAPTLEKACDFSTAAAPVVEPAGQPGGGSVVPPAPVAVDPAPAAEKPAVVAVVPEVEAQVSLTSGEQSSLGRVGLPTLLLLAVASAVAGSVLRWLELLQGLLVSARSSVRGARGSGGRRRAS